MEVTTGKFKGQQGTVLKCLRDRNQVVVEGVNVVRDRRTCLSALFASPETRLTPPLHFVIASNRD